MRKDNISQDAIEKAYLIYSERGHQIQDYSHAPTDYYRGTVMEPEQTSMVSERYQELVPSQVMSGNEYEQLKSQSESLNLNIDEMQNQMKISRQRGNFQQLHMQTKQLQSLIKQKEALDAKMATVDLTRKQMDDYKRTYDQESSYAETLTSIADRIAELEEKLASIGKTAD